MLTCAPHMEVREMEREERLCASRGDPPGSGTKERKQKVHVRWGTVYTRRQRPSGRDA